MSRKKRVEEHENHERWLVSYADFITLLFAFFVVMYSISSVNEGKYRVLSDSIVAAFRDPARALDPIQVGNLLRTPQQSSTDPHRDKPVIELFKLPIAIQPYEKNRADPQPEPDNDTVQEEHLDEASQKLADSIETAMSELVDEGLITVRRDKRWIEVEINSRILFASGSGELEGEAAPVLKELATKLRSVESIIHVEGFTDNVPISNFDYLSNWELSAARAASVVHLFTRLGIDPRRMAAIGYGEFRPIASNDTAEGRARNRRVVLVIMSGTDLRVNERDLHLQTTRENIAGPVVDAGLPSAAEISPVVQAENSL